MNRKFASIVFAFVSLAVGPGATIQATAQSSRAPIVFTTVPKLVPGRLPISNGPDFVIRGRASLTVTTANDDDTLTGTLVYVLPSDARQRIAQLVGKSLADIPTSLAVKKVTAKFQRGTACPLVQLEILLKEADFGGTRLFFDHINLDIRETPDQINQLFCSWTRQINAKRQRQGIIAAVNRLITVEE